MTFISKFKYDDGRCTIHKAKGSTGVKAAIEFDVRDQHKKLITG